MIEAWRPVVGFEGQYEVSSEGEVRRAGGPVLKQMRHAKGYLRVCLSDGTRKTWAFVHRLVAQAFLTGLTADLQVDHIDANRTNNAVPNLRVCTAAENRRFTVERGAHAHGQRNGQSKLSPEQVAEIRAAKAGGGRYWGANRLAAKFGVRKQCVQRAADGVTYAAQHTDGGQ